ncbi:MAG TPA: C39 family peptidase [Bryobacteraceae bacterium]|nr:C39 family peptidase [Bryobacteraceae bacterium]
MKIATAIGALVLAGLAQPAGLWLDIPFVKQSEDGCGPAALSMVMQYWGAHGARVAPADAAGEARIRRDLLPVAARGVRTAAMREYLGQHGFRVVVFRGEWADLREHVSKGRPLIVLIDGGAKLLHYVVVAGVEEDGVMVNDPADRKLRAIGRAEFEKRWRAGGFWTLLAVPRPES